MGERELVNVMTPLPLFLRKDVIPGMLRTRRMQECDSKGVTGILISGGGLGLWRGWLCRALGGCAHSGMVADVDGVVKLYFVNRLECWGWGRGVRRGRGKSR